MARLAQVVVVVVVAARQDDLLMRTEMGGCAQVVWAHLLASSPSFLLLFASFDGCGATFMYFIILFPSTTS